MGNYRRIGSKIVWTLISNGANGSPSKPIVLRKESDGYEINISEEEFNSKFIELS